MAKRQSRRKKNSGKKEEWKKEREAARLSSKGGIIRKVGKKKVGKNPMLNSVDMNYHDTSRTQLNRLSQAVFKILTCMVFFFFLLLKRFPK